MDADEDLERVLRAGSKSFHLASRLLPSRVRTPTLALYAFCRHADDAVDDAPSERDARFAVDALRARVDRVYADHALDSVVERAFSRVVQRFAIPRAIPDALIEGMEWDVQGRSYDRVEDVRAYGVRVAGTVGLMMTLIMGSREPEVLARACDLGVAMQLTNIARDVGEDARRGRLYLPGAWLSEAGVDRERFLAEPEASEGVRAVVARLLDDAESLYARADTGIAHLPRDCRVAIRSARLVYSAIGGTIRKAGFDSVSRRAVVPLPQKLWLVLRAFGARTWRAQPLVELASVESLPLLGAVAS
ncbi:MAG TPA: phytoene/squalene synthase family protein [Labilithrix sp.]|nr:phytoene/squalene synthase family protein [Labilithrix sp.]